MASVKRLVELTVEEKKFLDKFLGMLYDEFNDYEETEIGGVMADVYNLCLSENRPFPQTYEGDFVTVQVKRED